MIDLSQFERQRYSQNGEDGVVARILDAIETTDRVCLEIGGGDGVTNNSHALREDGWRVIAVDAVHENRAIGLYRETVTPGNAPALLDRYRVPLEMDLLSVDIDSVDWYVTRALLESACRPRVVVVEYNASFSPPDDRVVMPDATVWDGTRYFGASLAAYVMLFKRFDYHLVYCEERGVNAFFVRGAAAGALFINADDVAMLYRAPTYGAGGHPPEVGKRWMSARQLLTEPR